MKRVLRTVPVVVLAAIVAFVAAEGVYYPSYRRDQTKLFIGDKEQTREITAVSANVRCFSPTDLFRRSWFYRAPLQMKTLTEAQPDIIGFQEVTWLHLNYLRERLKGYEYVLCYRDGSPMSEGCPIFYSGTRFTAVDKGSFWLSETPEVSSKSWGAAFPRICTYVILEQNDGKRLAVFNTHLDHVSQEARINGIRLVLEKLREYGDLPCVLMGDLNTGEATPTYEAATALFDDAKYRAPETDSGATYQNWGAALNRENIDYFMISKQGISPLKYKVLRNTYDGVYPSDHFPILLRFTL